MRHHDLVTQARNTLAEIVVKTEAAGANNLLDLNVISEGLVLRLLQIAWDRPGMRSLNASERTNFPGIDLADDQHGLAIQVTATATLGKIKRTISTFLSHDLDKRYSRLVVVIITALPDGRIVSSGADEVIRVWLRPSQVQQSFIPDTAALSLTIAAPDLIVAGGEEGAVHFLHCSKP
jgi:hypothetical protein